MYVVLYVPYCSRSSLPSSGFTQVFLIRLRRLSRRMHPPGSICVLQSSSPFRLTSNTVLSAFRPMYGSTYDLGGFTAAAHRVLRTCPPNRRPLRHTRRTAVYHYGKPSRLREVLWQACHGSQRNHRVDYRTGMSMTVQHVSPPMSTVS